LEKHLIPEFGDGYRAGDAGPPSPDRGSSARRLRRESHERVVLEDPVRDHGCVARNVQRACSMRAMSNLRTAGARPRRPAALLWDNDGVLVDTEELPDFLDPPRNPDPAPIVFWASRTHRPRRCCQVAGSPERPAISYEAERVIPARVSVRARCPRTYGTT
jgi:hypothetical protein